MTATSRLAAITVKWMKEHTPRTFRPSPKVRARWGLRRSEAGGGLREQVRCSSLIDWPVYPGLRPTRRPSSRSRNRARGPHTAIARLRAFQRQAGVEKRHTGKWEQDAPDNCFQLSPHRLVSGRLGVCPSWLRRRGGGWLPASLAPPGPHRLGGAIDSHAVPQ
jgi:hypothetical protein